jgi:hypothetical protein
MKTIFAILATLTLASATAQAAPVDIQKKCLKTAKASANRTLQETARKLHMKGDFLPDMNPQFMDLGKGGVYSLAGAIYRADYDLVVVVTDTCEVKSSVILAAGGN